MVTYCPGGTRPAGAPSRRPLKPREMIGGITPATLADHPIVSQHPAPHNTLPRHQRRQPGRADVTETALASPTSPWNSPAPSGPPAPQHLPPERPASLGLRCGPQPGTGSPRVVSRSRDTRLSATACARHARRFSVLPMISLPQTGLGRPHDQEPPDADPAPALPADRRAPPGRPRPRTLPCSRRPGPAWSRSARPLPGFAGARYEQPEQPHRMTRGGSSWPRT